MSVEKSEHGALITNAYYITEDYDWIVRASTPGQWNVVDNYTIRMHYAGGYDIPQGYEYLTWDSLVFNGYSGLNYTLEYSVRVYQYNTSTVLFESGWVDNNQLTYIVSRDWSPVSLSKMQSLDVYVRRKEFDEQGNRRYLVPSDMRPSGITMKYKAYTNIEEQTLPSDWFATTTASIPTYTTQTTMVTTVDYESYLSTLTVPADVRPAIAQLDQLINDLWSLHYIPFVVCFALIMGLAIWLLH